MEIFQEEIVYNCFLNSNGENEDDINRGIGYIENIIPHNDYHPLDDARENYLKLQLKELKKRFKTVKKSNKTWDAIKRNSGEFLKTAFNFEICPRMKTVKKCKKQKGPRQNSFQVLDRRTKWSKIKHVSAVANFNTTLLLEAALYASQRQNETAKTRDIKLLLGKIKKRKEQICPKVTKEEALELDVNNHLSKSTYRNFREFLRSKNVDLLPCYQILQKAKKDCYPNGFVCNGHEALIPLKDMVNHTADRLFKFLQINIKDLYMALIATVGH